MKSMRLSVLHGWILTSFMFYGFGPYLILPMEQCFILGLLMDDTRCCWSPYGFSDDPSQTVIATDLTCHVRVQGLNGTLLGVLLIVIHSLHKEIQLSGEHFYPIDGVHITLTGLESFLTPTHI